MKKLKINFKKVIISEEEIPVATIRENLKKIKNKNYYLSEIADYYYKNKYNKNILEVLDDYYKIPKCPITNNVVSYKLAGHIIFGKYSSSCSYSDISKYICENNENYKAHIERMKESRKGKGNPMYGMKVWNDGLTKETDDRLKNISEKMKGNKFSEETLKKMSESAKKRKVHGHTGHKHSEKSKQLMREKTISRFKRGKFPQTNTIPHREVKKILEEIFGKVGGELQEEFGYGNFVFDFKVLGFLIEVQGDYFHCNPNTRHAIPKSDIQKKNLERDKRKHKSVEKLGEYKLIEIWENDIINNIEKVKLCLMNLKK